MLRNGLTLLSNRPFFGLPSLGKTLRFVKPRLLMEYWRLTWNKVMAKQDPFDVYCVANMWLLCSRQEFIMRILHSPMALINKRSETGYYELTTPKTIRVSKFVLNFNLEEYFSVAWFQFLTMLRKPKANLLFLSDWNLPKSRLILIRAEHSFGIFTLRLASYKNNGLYALVCPKMNVQTTFCFEL